MGVPITHFEIGCRNLENGRKFYGELFGWEFQEMMGVAMVCPQGRGIGGHLSAAGQPPSNHVTFYAEVEDLEHYLAHATRLGAQVIIPKTEIPQMGWFAWFADPDGNVIGLWQNL